MMMLARLLYVLSCLAVAAVMLCAGGCSYTHYQDPAGRDLTTIDLFGERQIPKLTASATTQESRLEIEGYSKGVDADAVGAAVTAALKAAARAGGGP